MDNNDDDEGTPSTLATATVDTNANQVTTSTTKFHCQLCNCDITGTELWNHYLQDPMHKNRRKEAEVMLRTEETFRSQLRAGQRQYEDRIAALPCRQWQNRVLDMVLAQTDRTNSSKIGTVLQQYEKLGAILLVLELAVWKAMCQMQTPSGGFKDILEAFHWSTIGWKQVKSSMRHCNAIEIITKHVLRFLSETDILDESPSTVNERYIELFRNIDGGDY